MMKKILILWSLFTVLALSAAAQDFLTKGKIEFEVKVNSRKKMAEFMEGRDDVRIQVDVNMPEFTTFHRTLVFSGNRSYYNQAEDLYNRGEIGVYMDLDKKQSVALRRIITDMYVVEDSIAKIRWKIGNEIRTIAGWKCRKAVGRIRDSVYVVAFYCPEIIPQGGPEFFTGLPGMILGLAIPRYYTTWFATKVEVVGLDESVIKPPKPKKDKDKVYSRKEMETYFDSKYGANQFFDKKMLKMLRDDFFGFVL